MVNYPLIVDVREYFEYKRSRLKDAVNIQSSGNLESTVDTLDKFSHIFLYCTTDFRSIRVAKFLVENGFIHVYSLDGGIKAWKKAGLPVEKRKIRKGKTEAGSRKTEVGIVGFRISDFGLILTTAGADLAKRNP
jgi:rhodanese-related sulfurtransferase